MQNHRIEEIRIGVMVLAALATLIVLTLIFGKQSIINFGEYTLTVSFQETPGIKINTPVYKNGVQIGRVSKISLVDEDREVEVTILLPKDRKIYSDEECRVRKTMLMGDSTLEFVKRKKYVGEITEIPPNTPLVGAPTLDLIGGFSSMEGDIHKAVSGIANTTEKISAFMDRANVFIGSPDELKATQRDFQESLHVLTQTMHSVRKMVEGTGGLFNDPVFQADTKRIVHELPDALQQSRKLLNDSGELVKEFRAAIARSTTTMDKFDAGLGKIDTLIAKVDKGFETVDVAVQKFGVGIDHFVSGVESVTKFTDKIGDDGAELIQSLRRSGKKLETLFDDISTIIQAVGNADGTVKRLMRDPEMYENLMRTLANIEKITEDVNTVLRTDVKPITNNVRIITDKVARDPSVFIRNLMKKQPPTKSLPVWGDGLGSDVLSVDNFDMKQFKDGSIIYEETPKLDSNLLGSDELRQLTLSYEQTRQRPSFCQRIAAMFPCISRNATNSKTTTAGQCSPENYGEQITPPTLEPPINQDSEEDIPILLMPPEQESAAIPLPNGSEKNTVNGSTTNSVPPKSVALPTDEVPVEGRVVCVDPRYVSGGTTSTFQQMSYDNNSERNTDTEPPKLNFTR